MRIVSGNSDQLPPGVLLGAARYRFRVFVQQLGWQLKTQDGMEFDQFDRPDTLYIVAHNERDDIVGTARLLPTTRPYLLSEVFPQLLGGLPAPISPEVWELSRFASMDFSAANSSALGQLSSPIAMGLLRAAIDAAAEQGAKQLITVSPLGVERLLSKAGFRAHRLGPPVLIDGRPLFACFIEV